MDWSAAVEQRSETRPRALGRPQPAAKPQWFLEVLSSAPHPSPRPAPRCQQQRQEMKLEVINIPLTSVNSHPIYCS